MNRHPVRGCGAALALAVALLAGCVTTTEGAPAKDIPTASDQTDAARRANTRLELAGAYFTSGQYTTALDEVKQAIAAQPNMSEAYNLRGLIYAAMGDDALADESFRYALQLNPRSGDVMQNYGWYQCLMKRYAQADALFEQALATPQYRDTTRTLLAQGVCQARAGKLPEAESTLKRAFALDPGNPAVAVNYADVLYQRGAYDRARFYVQRVNSDPKQSNAQTLWLAARIEHRAGNQQAANDFGQQLRSRYPKSRESTAFDQGNFDE
ncbi:MAG: type IV pilus biogenesis/stability protein PilW [Burkholderiales bacterium]